MCVSQDIYFFLNVSSIQWNWFFLFCSVGWVILIRDICSQTLFRFFGNERIIFIYATNFRFSGCWVAPNWLRCRHRTKRSVVVGRAKSDVAQQRRWAFIPSIHPVFPISCSLFVRTALFRSRGDVRPVSALCSAACQQVSFLQAMEGCKRKRNMTARNTVAED